jgi:ribonuclease E
MVKKKNDDLPIEEVVETKKPARKRGAKEVIAEVVAEVAAPQKKSKKKEAEPKESAPEKEVKAAPAAAGFSLIFQAPDLPTPKVNTRRGKPSIVDDAPTDESHRRVRSRRRSGEAVEGELAPNVVVKVRTPREPKAPSNEPTRVKGSTRLEAKKQRRRDGRDSGRRSSRITESEFLARREAVDRVMVVRSKDDKIQIGVLEDKILVEHYVAKAQDSSLIGNVYLGKIQNVLPSMEAAFVDIGRGRNAVLYSGEVDWELAEVGNQPRKIELALKSGDNMNGISRKLPESERVRLKKILKEILPPDAGVIIRTAAEGATEEQLTEDVQRLQIQWEEISRNAEISNPPSLLSSEPDLLIKIVRDVFNEDFQKMIIDGDAPFATIEGYLKDVAPDLLERVERFSGEGDAFDHFRINEQIIKALDRKVYLPSGGSLVIDRTEAMTVVDVNTGKFIGSGGNLEETVTKNNLEAAEEIVRQLRLRDIGGIIVVDFIDMVLESNRDLVLRRVMECLSRDRTKHQVAEVTSLGLVQMTRKKIGIGLLEAFTEPCETCAGRGLIVHHEPVLKNKHIEDDDRPQRQNNRDNNKGKNKGKNKQNNTPKADSEPNKPRIEPAKVVTPEKAEEAKNLMSKIAASSMATSEAAPKTLETVLDALPASPDVPAKRKSRRVSSGGEITPGGQK